MSDSWRQPGYDGAHTSYNPDATGVPNGLRLRFELWTNARTEVTSAIVTRSAYVIATEQSVVGYDRNDGTLAWRRLTGSKPTSNPVAPDDILLFDDGVHGFEPAAARYEWHRPAETEWKPAVTLGDDGLVFFGTAAGSDHEFGTVYAVDPGSRTVRDLDAPSFGTASPLLVSGSTVVCYRPGRSGRGELEAFDTDGTRSWRREPDPRSSLYPRLVGNGRVVVSDSVGDDSRVVAYDVDTGARDWQASFDVDWENADTALVRDVLYVADASHVVAVNSHTGNPLWRYDRDTPGQDDDVEVSTTLVATLKSLCVGGDEPVGLDPDTGRHLWDHDEPLRFHAVVDDEVIASRPSPNYGGHEVYVFSDDATKVYDPDSG